MQKFQFAEIQVVKSGWVKYMIRGRDINIVLNHCKSAVDMQSCT